MPNFPATGGDLRGSAGGQEDQAGASVGNTNVTDFTTWGFSPS